MTTRILAPFFRRDIPRAGVCSFAALPPLLPVGSRRALPDRPASVLVCALPYYDGEYPARNVARYSVCDDYHRTGGALLGEIAAELRGAFPGRAFVPFIDAGPIPEVQAARLAGVGAVGRHGMLLIPQYGARVFLGCIVTDLAAPPSVPLQEGCPGCGACVAACPTGALTAGGFVRGKCLSHLTQQKGELSSVQQAQLRAGGLAWGCDACVDACPLSGKALTPLAPLRENPQPVLTPQNLDRLLGTKAYGYRGQAVLERNLRILGSGAP